MPRSAGRESGPDTAGPTVADQLRGATARLDRAGVEAPAREARLLLAHAGLDRMAQLTEPGARLDIPTADAFAALVTRRARREPLAHLTERREFYGLDFVVSPAVLVPRPETETLVDAALHRIADRHAPLRLLDIATGSGCILTALLHHLPAAFGIGTDRSGEALAIARRNAVALGVGARAAFVRTDWAACIDGSFDLVLANPPYIERAMIDRLDAEVRCFEPRLALDGGPDGLAAYHALGADLGRLLRPGGRAFLEIGRDQEAALMPWFETLGLAGRGHPDLAGIVRCLELTRGSASSVVART